MPIKYSSSLPFKGLFLYSGSGGICYFYGDSLNSKLFFNFSADLRRYSEYAILSSCFFYSSSICFSLSLVPPGEPGTYVEILLTSIGYFIGDSRSLPSRIGEPPAGTAPGIKIS